MLKLNRIMLLFCCVVFLCALSSCGSLEKAYDSENYESLTNETGDIYVLSGGKVMYEYKNAKIIYSSSDTQAMWIKCNKNEYYLQGDLVIKLH